MPGADLHEFGPFRYDPAQRQLFRDGQPVPLVPKAVDTLHVLLERRGRIVDKATLPASLPAALNEQIVAEIVRLYNPSPRVLSIVKDMKGKPAISLDEIEKIKH